MTSLGKTVAVDIDGTLADNSRRVELLNDNTVIKDPNACLTDGSPCSYLVNGICKRPAHCHNKSLSSALWTEFEKPENLMRDLPMPGALIALTRFKESGATIIAVTGRRESCRKATEEWLELHFPGLIDNILMRRTDDIRDGVLVKMELLEEYWDDLLIVLDDDLHFVESLRRRGIHATRPLWDVVGA